MKSVENLGAATPDKNLARFTALTEASFRGGRHVYSPIAGGDNGGLAAILSFQRSRNRGVIPAARCPIGTNPANGETVVIAGHTFKFVNALGAAAAQTQVLIGADAAHSITSLINAINGVTDATVVPATTPFSQPVVADLVAAGVVRVRFADAQNGTPIPATPIPSLALSASLTSGDAWGSANLNASGTSLLALTAVPTANDTVTIAGATFKFVSALGGAVAQTQVLIGADIPTTLVNLAKAINDVSGDAVNIVAGTTALTAAVVADLVESATAGYNSPDTLRLQVADATGGRSLAGMMCPSFALSETMADGANGPWTVTNLNASGKAMMDQDEARCDITVTAAMIASGFDVELPFAPTGGTMTVTNAGAARATAANDKITFSGDAVHIAFDGGVAPAIQAGDVIHLHAWS